jgi:MEMO1 family protein
MSRIRYAVAVGVVCWFVGHVVTGARRHAEQEPGAVRMPAVAGTFYPGERGELKAAIEGYLRDAVPARVPDVVALVVPHAGYVFSGQIAADAYNQVRNQTFDTVVILGANHTTGGFTRASVFDGAEWRTPLGTVAVDRGLAEALVHAGAGAVFDRRLHEQEHSVEVQVPFVQVFQPRARIIPIVIGSQEPAFCSRLGQALATLLKNRRALIVASSDLSHYPGARDARRVDARTLQILATGSDVRSLLTDLTDARGGESQEAPGLVTRACGLGAIMVAMEAGRGLGALRATVISYANSADTLAGDPDRVVGYGAMTLSRGTPGADTAALVEPRADGQALLDASDKQILLRLARETVTRQLTSATLPLPRSASPRLLREAGAFVTLKSHGALRGCIGRLSPDGTLIRLVSAMAREAAFNDPRFQPVSARELGDLEIEVSVLTPMRAVRGPDDIVVGRDGVVLRVGERAAVFLPQVATEQGWTKSELLDNLALKAGMPASGWRNANARFQTFQSDVFSDAGHK